MKRNFLSNICLGVFVVLLFSNIAFAESVIFLHHSVGYALIENGDVREGLTARGQEFYDHGYNDEGLRLADGSYSGTNYAVPEDNTDPDGFAAIFSQPLHAPPDNTFSYLMQYDVIVFKSCFYANHITSDGLLDDYKSYYLSIRDRIDSHPDKLFIIVTIPPRSPTETGDERPEYAARAREFANWLKSEEYLGTRENVVVFDLFNYLAASDNFLRPEYRTGDSHPNELADETIGPLFVDFIDGSIDDFSPGEPGPTCNDNDGGRVYTVQGTASDSTGASETDSCLADGRLREYYCTADNTVTSETVSCSAGYECSSGRCVESDPGPTCSDSDGGRIHGTQGTTEDSTGTTNTDACLADGRLQEYYCAADSTVTSETVSCSAGYECDTGRCIESDPEPSGSGSVIIDFETDEYSWDRWDGTGSTMTCARTSSSSHEGSWSLDGTYNVRSGHEVTCGTSFDGVRDLSDGTGLSFWYRSGVAGRTVKFSVFSGNPDDPTPFEAYFTTSAESVSGWDQVSFLWSDFEKAPWAWQPETEVNSARVTGISFGTDVVSANSWYIDDVILLSSDPEPEPTCSDSDGGRIHGTQGTTEDSTGTTNTDACLADGRLQEYYCAADSTVTSETVSCVDGYECSSGACVESEPEPACDDSDGGRIYSSTGTTNDSLGTTGTDNCLADGRLREYYCAADNTVTSETVSCSAGYECDTGRCMESEPEPEPSDFCPVYEESDLYRARSRTVTLNPPADSSDFSWLTTISGGASDTEYILNPGTYPFPSLDEVLWSDFVIGDSITIRGATGNPDDVVLQGQGYGPYCEGFIVAGRNVVISDLTMKDMRHHAISIKPDMGAEAPYIYNVHLYDIGTQVVKLPLGGVSDGVIACSEMGYSSEDTVAGDYIGAMSLHAATDWVIRDNVFYNFVGEGNGCEVDIDCGTYITGPAVTIWSDSSGTIIERNIFRNNFRSLALGLGRGCDGGIVRNNLIYRDGSFNPGAGVGDAGIELWTADNVVIAHNTLYATDDYPGLIEVRDGTGITIANNLMSTDIWDRGSASLSDINNVNDLTLDDFVTPGEVHVNEDDRFIGVCSLRADVTHDFDGDVRDACHVGADHITDVIPPEPTCSDSDSGRIYSSLGTTSNSSGTSHSDSCLADGRLVEYYCLGTAVTSETVSCTDGYECSLGRCVESDPGPSGSELVQPSDVEYLGAFKLPGASGGSDWTWNAGSAATYYPDGDPDGPNDGFTGSLYATSHDHQQMVSEITIPIPVNSRNLADLNTAETLQPFSNIRGSSFPAISDFGYPAIEYLPAQGAQTTDKLHLAWGQHLFDNINVNTHSWCELDLSDPRTPAAWRVEGYTPFVTADYMFEIPASWAAENTLGMRLATGRFREGYWSGRGPALFAYGPWNEGNPPSGTVDAIPLLLYGVQEPGGLEITNYDHMQIDNYAPPDEWSGGAWLTAGDKSSLIFVGTKATGDNWYGYSDGTRSTEESPAPPPPWPHNDRGFWSEDIEAQIIFYDPADLAAVVAGEMESYEPQPYAVMNIDEFMYDPGFNHERDHKKFTVGAAAFDRENGLLYVFERRVGVLDEASVVHVFRIDAGSVIPTNTPPTVSDMLLQGSTETPDSYEDLLLTFDVSDADGDSVKTTTNWYVDDELITVLNLPFEAGSDAHDYASGTDATVNDAVWIRDAGHDGFGAYSFADDASIVLDSGTGYLSSYTFSARIKRDSTAEWDIFAYGNNNAQYFGFHPGSTDSIIVSYRNSTGAQRTCYSDIRIDDTEWHHIVVTGESNGYIRIYIDGVQSTTRRCKHPYNNGGFAEYSLIEQLGAYRSAGYGFDGSMDDVQVFNRALSPEQVTELYENSGTIVSQETEPGDVWRACVIPNDGTEDGSEECSNRLTVEDNDAPVVENVVLSGIDTLSLTFDVSDADGDSVKTTTNWYVDDELITVLNLPFEVPSTLTRTFDYGTATTATVDRAVFALDNGYDGFGAYSFADDAGIDLASGTGYLSSYTFSARIKRDSTAEWDIFAYGNNNAQYFGFHPHVLDRLVVSYRNSTGAQRTCYSNTRIDDTEWHHIVVTGESDGYIRIYIDGVRDGATYCRHPYNNGGFGEYSLIEQLGRYRSAGFGFDGSMDDVQVFNRALSPEQVTELYENTGTIVSQETEPGDVWRACVVPFDSIEPGEQVCSNELSS